MKAQLLTWAASVLSAALLGWAWIHTHPAPKMARADVNGLFEERRAVLEKKIKPGMSEQEQKAVFQEAAEYAVRLENALTTVANECGCAVLNSAAILRTHERGMSDIVDVTARLRELAGL